MHLVYTKHVLCSHALEHCFRRPDVCLCCLLFMFLPCTFNIKFKSVQSLSDVNLCTFTSLVRASCRFRNNVSGLMETSFLYILVCFQVELTLTSRLVHWMTDFKLIWNIFKPPTTFLPCDSSSQNAQYLRKLNFCNFYSVFVNFYHGCVHWVFE